MFNWIVKWGVKKWLVGVVNTALKDYDATITASREFLCKVIARVDAITAFLKSLDRKLSDGVVTDDEADEAIEDAAELATQLTAK